MRFVEHKFAVDNGQEIYAKKLETEISELMREKESIEAWAVVGSA
jgi:hypothetical protein